MHQLVILFQQRTNALNQHRRSGLPKQISCGTPHFTVLDSDYIDYK